MKTFYKILNGLSPKYWSDIILLFGNSGLSIRAYSSSELLYVYGRTKKFSKIFFSYYIKEWNKSNAKIRNLESLSKFQKALLVYLPYVMQSTFLLQFNFKNNKESLKIENT